MSKIDLNKHTFHLRAGDYRRIQEMFPKRGAADVIRTIVSRFVDKADAPANPIKVDVIDD
jgi:hypothetical protein